ncbi:MAG: class I SAM-dependent methyltransferase [Rhodospirillales bacterium]|nr:class I SAM-dependent methyltransferase [Rhodospirillales bacterium]
MSDGGRSVNGDLTELKHHFRFGENWRSFSASLDDVRIDAAIKELKRLCPDEILKGARMLDIGCGSGLSALAALRSGCSAVRCIDLDPDSVATTSAMLNRLAVGKDWTVAERSVFDLDAAQDGQFDIVHSWGVLHHTGRMWEAVGCAADLVRPGGHLVVALYAKTPVCRFWRTEKRLYAKAPGGLQAAIRGVFRAAYLIAIAASGRNPVAYVRDYPAKRGMSWSHDVHDWLGGYPYESATPAEVGAFLSSRGFVSKLENIRPVPALGVFGSPCHEYLFRRGTIL